MSSPISDMIRHRPKPPGRRKGARSAAGRFLVHAVLVTYVVIALGPVLLIIINSLKDQKAIFANPFNFPTKESLTFAGYEKVIGDADFGKYFLNSFTVTLVSVFATLLLAALAGYALSEYATPVTEILLGFFAIGIMLPIRLGTVSLLKLMASWHLVNTLTSLILVYIAMSLPLAIILMTQFMKQVPNEIKESGRIDGAHELRIFSLTLPLIRPGLAAVSIVSMLPIWNDLWFPLILAPSKSTSTVTLGIQQFVGQYGTDWGAVLSALSLGAIPLIVLFVLFSRQFVSGLTAGITK